jgi:hypothetical protein
MRMHRFMKISFWTLTSAVAATGLGACGKATPKVSDMQEPVTAYLIAYKKSTCSGQVTLDKLEIKNVGAYQENFGGFPVYANFAVTCRDGGVKSTFKSSDADTMRVATCSARKVAGAWECIMPAFFAEGERELKRKMEEMTKQAPSR